MGQGCWVSAPVEDSSCAEAARSCLVSGGASVVSRRMATLDTRVPSACRYSLHQTPSSGFGLQCSSVVAWRVRSLTQCNDHAPTMHTHLAQCTHHAQSP